MQHLEEVRNILSDVLSLGERKNQLQADSTLLGIAPSLPRSTGCPSTKPSSQPRVCWTRYGVVPLIRRSR